MEPAVNLEQASMPAHVEEAVRSIALLHAKHHQDATSTQLYIGRATEFAARPLFLGLVCMAAGIWIAANLVLVFLDLRPFDPPPFGWLELFLTLTALLTAVLILGTQKRTDKLADMRGQMTLELALLTEQKTAKIIELVEELRRDSPEIRDRLDSEASEMSAKSDAHAVLGAIKETDIEMRAA